MKKLARMKTLRSVKSFLWDKLTDRVCMEEADRAWHRVGRPVCLRITDQVNMAVRSALGRKSPPPMKRPYPPSRIMLNKDKLRSLLWDNMVDRAGERQGADHPAWDMRRSIRAATTELVLGPIGLGPKIIAPMEPFA